MKTARLRTSLVLSLLSALALLAAPRLASADVVVSISQPSVGNPIRFGQTLFVRAVVTSVDELSTVVATVGGRSLPLTFSAPYWSGTITTGDLPFGPMTLSVVATDVHGVSGQAQKSVFHDNPPTVEYLSPEYNALARPDVRVHARCTDDGGPCQLRTEGGGAELTGTGEVDGVISLAPLDGRELHIEVIATDSAGQSTGIWRPVWVESSPRLALLATLPGLILDINASQALVIDELVPRRAIIVGRLGGPSQVIYTEGSRAIVDGRLTPGGGALLRTSQSGQPGRLHEWRNGALIDLGDLASMSSPLEIAGNWTVFTRLDAPCCGMQSLVRRDLVNGVDTVISTTALNNGNTVAANGDVIYAEPSTAFDYDLYRFSGGSSSPLVVDAATNTYAPKTDGVITAFRANTGQNYGIKLHTPNGIETLVDGLPSSAALDDYRVNNGWTAFVKPGVGGSQQVWARSPAGVLRQVTSIGGMAHLEALGANGDVVYWVFTAGATNRRYLAPGTGDPAIEMGSSLGTPVFIHPYWCVAIGPHLLVLEHTTRWYLSEGATGAFFDLDVSVLNPGAASVSSLFTFLTETGNQIQQHRTLSPHSQTTVHVDDEPGLGATAVSTTVLTDGEPLVVERTMAWDATGYGGHSGSAVGGPRMRWYFAEGAQGYFDTFILLVNDRTAPTQARLTFLVEGGLPVQRTVTVPAGSRLTVFAGGVPELVNRSFSTVVESADPIVAERAMYFGGPQLWAGGHESAGVPDPARRWYHAEGATGPIFDTFLLLANPNVADTQVALSFLTDAGVTVAHALTLPARPHHPDRIGRSAACERVVRHHRAGRSADRLGARDVLVHDRRPLAGGAQQLRGHDDRDQMGHGRRPRRRGSRVSDLCPCRQSVRDPNREPDGDLYARGRRAGDANPDARAEPAAEHFLQRDSRARERKLRRRRPVDQRRPHRGRARHLLECRRGRLGGRDQRDGHTDSVMRYTPGEPETLTARRARWRRAPIEVVAMTRTPLALALLLSLLVVPTGARESDVARDMRAAAAAFLASLDEGQRAKATFAFDADERLNWHFVPKERKGLPLYAMTPAQQTAAAALLRSSLSKSGVEKADRIRQLEDALLITEKERALVPQWDGRPYRDHDRYFFTIFGTPSSDKPWGWRYEGHHVSQNWTVVGGSAVASSPQFFGSNPAEVREGPLKGWRVLASEEDLARTFLASLDADQKALAIVSPEAPKDILSMNSRDAAAIDDRGVTWAKLTAGQQKLLSSVIEEYAFAQAPAIGAERMTRVRKDLESIRFAWLGSSEKGGLHYYRIQGAAFLIEYDNTQNGGNHIHSVWRDFKGDFGRDLLAEHYKRDHSGGSR